MNSLLIIDDDEAIISVVKQFFLQKGFRVLSALSGKSGIDQAKSQQPQIILLDQILPDMHGIEVLKELKNDDRTKRIPVLMFTDYPGKEAEKDSVEAGAKEFVLKFSLDPEQLYQKVTGVLNEVHEAESTL